MIGESPFDFAIPAPLAHLVKSPRRSRTTPATPTASHWLARVLIWFDVAGEAMMTGITR